MNLILDILLFNALHLIVATKIWENMGRGGGQVVSVLAFYSDDPSSNPAEVYNFSVKLLLKSTKINKKRPGLAHLKKMNNHLTSEQLKRAGGAAIKVNYLRLDARYHNFFCQKLPFSGVGVTDKVDNDEWKIYRLND